MGAIPNKVWNSFVPLQTESPKGANGLAPEQFLNVVIDVVVVLLAVVVAWFLSEVMVRVIRRQVARRVSRPTVVRTVLTGIRLLMVMIGVLVAAIILGYRPVNALVSIGVFSAVLALILAPIVGAVISGVFVLWDRPYEVGDLIEVADQDQIGFVNDVTLRHTKVYTLDKTYLVIPNSRIRGRDVINYSSRDERIRRSLDLLVTYESDISQARNIIEEAARDVDSVISDSPDVQIQNERYAAEPTCYINEYADNGVMLTLRYWAKKPYKLLDIHSRIQENVWDLIHEEGVDVDIPYPHSHLLLDEEQNKLRVLLEDKRELRADPTE